jgi:tRNA G26 N,N-dimethylase Trm1
MTPQEEEALALVEQIINHLEEMKKKYSMDFVLFKLDEIAKESGMEESMKKSIIEILKDPTKQIVAIFKPKT